MANILFVFSMTYKVMRQRVALANEGHIIEMATSTRDIDLLWGRDASQAPELVICENDIEEVNSGVRLAARLRNHDIWMPFILYAGEHDHIEADLQTLEVERVSDQTTIREFTALVHRLLR
jgi:hypothetical protein